MLTIRHLTGPLAGTETRIEPDVDRVVFGRRPDCQIIYPPEETLVSRHHFALVRKASGDWTVDLFGEPFVALNGDPAEQGQGVTNGARIELGKRGGPAFETVIAADAPQDNYPVTEQQEEAEGPRVIARRAKTAASRARTLALLGVLIAVVAVAVGGYEYVTGKSQAARFTRALDDFASEQAKAASLSIGPDVRDHLTASVYHVVKRNTKSDGFDAVGTAWPVGPHTLATNSHVAEERDQLGADQVMAVRAPGPEGKLYDVIAHKMHPGYAAFSAFVSQDPVVVKQVTGQAVSAGLDVAGYDVALLEIKEDLPMQSIFTLASPAELKELRAGTPLATAGYPSEEITGSSAELVRATPELHLGTVTGLTDFFFLPSDEPHMQLVHHDIPSAGGASGSPIVNSKGHVVALLSAGNAFMMPKISGLPYRIPNAALINYGQRVDVLQELIDGVADKALEADKGYWAKQVSYFSRGMDLLIPEILDDSKPKPDAVPAAAFDQPLKLTADDKKAKDNGKTQRQVSINVPVTPGSPYTFIAYASNEAHLELYLMAGDKIHDRKTDGKWFPWLNYTPAAGETQVTLWIVSPEDKDVSYVLRAYRWDTKTPSG
jgi:V8-like Glu-specific endopeptidase